MTLIFSVSLLVAAQAGAGSASQQGPGETGSPSKQELKMMVTQVCLEHGVDPKLVDALVRVESGYDPSAVSRKGAMGLMQLMPATARRFDLEDPFDPEGNVRAGVREFSRLVDRYSGNLQFALAAYNAGEGAVARYRGVPPYAETRSYISQILTLYTGHPYRFAKSYRAIPVRLVKDPSGQTVITNVSPSKSSYAVQRAAQVDGPLRGGFGSK